MANECEAKNPMTAEEDGMKCLLAVPPEASGAVIDVAKKLGISMFKLAIWFAKNPTAFAAFVAAVSTGNVALAITDVIAAWTASQV